MPTHRDIARAIEAVAPISLQESWDNSGFQVGDPDGEATGVLICVDATEDIVAEAIERGCSMVVSHHPLLFRGVKQVTGRNRGERVLAALLRAGLTLYSCHTPIDSAPGGVSWQMGNILGLCDSGILHPESADSGFGLVGNLPTPLTPAELIERVKAAFGSPVVRCSRLTKERENESIKRVALCGGAGADFISDAIEAGATAYINSDTKLNYFLDYADRLLLIDIGHYESEMCTKLIFYHILSGKFTNFAVLLSEREQNPINYC